MPSYERDLGAARSVGGGGLPARAAAAAGGQPGRLASRRCAGRRRSSCDEPGRERRDVAAARGASARRDRRRRSPAVSRRRRLAARRAGRRDRRRDRLAIGLAVDARQVLFSWLIAYTFALTIVLGMAAFLMACHTMAATWPVALQRLAEATTAIMPLAGAVPAARAAGPVAALSVDAPRTRSPTRTSRELLRHKLPLMNRPFVIVRARLLRRGVGRDLRRAAPASRWRWIAPARRDPTRCACARSRRCCCRRWASPAAGRRSTG